MFKKRFWSCKPCRDVIESDPFGDLFAVGARGLFTGNRANTTDVNSSLTTWVYPDTSPVDKRVILTII